jgi:tetratricopeptide (TPR) repeat protein
VKIPTSHTSTPEVENAMDMIANGINTGGTIIFCGAGISRDSGFPVVNDFVPYVLLRLCIGTDEITAIEGHLKDIANDQQRRDTLTKLTAEKMAVSQTAINNIINTLPFEAFVETILNRSTNDELLRIFNADAYEPPVEPNTNHMLLAKVAVAGKVKTIVTTNFDQLIEKAITKAFREDSKHGNFDYDVIYREDDFKHINWTQERFRLIKIHGSIDDPQAMAITLSAVATQELSLARAEVIRYVFSEGSHKQVLMMGYSCSDVFDVSPQIETLTDNLKQVCLVTHDRRPNIEDIRKQGLKNPFKAFVNSTRLSLGTGDLVKSLWKSTLGVDYPYSFAQKKALRTYSDWKANVHAWYVHSAHTQSDVFKEIIYGQLFTAVCEWQAAIDRYEHVLAYAREHAHSQFEGLALGAKGIAYLNLGKSSKAIEFAKQSLEIAKRIGDNNGEGAAFSLLGSAHYQRSNYRKAMKCFEKQMEVMYRINDIRGAGYAQGLIGLSYDMLGEYDNAIKQFNDSLDNARRTGDVRRQGTAHINMIPGTVYLILIQVRE